MTQEDIEKSPGQLSVRSITPARAAQIFTYVYKASFDEDEIRQIANDAQILRADDTFSLIEYCAFLIKEFGNAS